MTVHNSTEFDSSNLGFKGTDCHLRIELYVRAALVGVNCSPCTQETKA